MVDDFMLDDSIIKNKGHLGEDILNNIIKNLSIADEAIEEAYHEINKHDELDDLHYESFEDDIRDFNKFRWEYEEFTGYADEYDAMVDSNYKSRMESICEQLSDIRLENITIDNNLGIVDSEGSHYATFGGTRLKHKINIEDVFKVDHVDKAMKAEHEERRQMVQVMQKMVNEDNWPEGMSEDKKEAIRQYVSNLNGGKMESYDDEIKNLLTKGEFNFITDREQNLSLALDFVPIVGDIKGVIEAIKGKEMITNRELSDREKTMAGISSAVGFIPGVGEIGSIAKVGEKLGAKAVIKEAAKYTVKETVKGEGMYGVSSIASDLGITPRQQIMAMGGFSLYKGGKAVIKNPKVISAVNNTVDITKATVKDTIESNKGSAILSSNLGGYGGQLYNSFKKVTAERKALREGIASGESSISKVPENINNIKLKEIDTKESTISQIEQNDFTGKLRGENITLPGVSVEPILYVKRDNIELDRLRSSFNSSVRKAFLQDLSQNVEYLKEAGFTEKDILKMQNGRVPSGWQVHHKLPIDDSGTNCFENFVLIKNEPYHKVITNYQNSFAKKLKVGEAKNVNWPMVKGNIYPKNIKKEK